MGGDIWARNSEGKILEEQVDDCYEVGNNELDDAQVNNDIEENQLEHPQYKLVRRSEKYSTRRSQEIIEKEMPGSRQEIHKEETYNWYGGSDRKIEIGALWELGAFITA